MKYIYLILVVVGLQIGKAQTTQPLKKQVEQVNPYAEKTLSMNQFLNFDSEIMQFNFNSFKPNFDQRNIDLLDKPKLLWGVEYGVQYKTFLFAVNLNFGSQSGSISDSVDAKSNFTRFGCSGGLYVLNTRHIQIVPRTSIYINNISLKNFNAKDDLPLDEYTSNPDFKLNFRQYTLQFGVELNFKIPKISIKPGQPFLIGIKTSYNTDIGDTALKSDENTLKSKANISVKSFNYGFHFTMLI